MGTHGKLSRARIAYRQQEFRARKRGIAWEFSFEAWCEWWLETGRWYARGRRGDDYVMARIGEAGPYSPSNCICITQRQNLLDVDPAVRREVGRVNVLRAQLAAAKSLPVEIDGVAYPSIRAAAIALGVNPRTAHYRARQGIQGWRIVPQPSSERTP